jgi:MoaA/NifB/PqqE/SkfB family radical SAM enzyme
MDIDKLKENGSFCILPWIHQFIHTNGDVLPCCTSDYSMPIGNIKRDRIEDLWNGTVYKRLRSDMLAGKKNPICDSCYRSPDQSTTPRIHANRRFKDSLDVVKSTRLDGSVPGMMLRYLDIRWSNICNLKCRTCGEWNSSSWAAENKSNGLKPNGVFLKPSDDNTRLLDTYLENIDDIEEMYFAGGEPLLMDEHYQLLDRLVLKGRTDIALRYNTNMTTLSVKDSNILDRWNLFDRVIVSASLDSWGDRSSYIRHGSDWDQIVENILMVRKESPKTVVTFNTVVSVFNALTLTDFLNEMDRVGLLSSATVANASFHYLTDPAYFSPSILPDETRDAAARKIMEYSSGLPTTLSKLGERLRKVIIHLQQPGMTHLKKKCLEHVRMIDERRGEDFMATFPELAVWFSSDDQI